MNEREVYQFWVEEDEELLKILDRRITDIEYEIGFLKNDLEELNAQREEVEERYEKSEKYLRSL